MTMERRSAVSRQSLKYISYRSPEKPIHIPSFDISIGMLGRSSPAKASGSGVGGIVHTTCKPGETSLLGGVVVIVGNGTRSMTQAESWNMCRYPEVGG